MTLKDVRTWLSSHISGQDSLTIGKLDSTKSKSICIYNRGSPAHKAVGAESSYGTKKICILIHWTTNCDTAEQKAQEIYNLFSTQSIIGGCGCFFNMETSEPVCIGTDDKGVYEFTIDLTITFRKE